MKRYSNDPKKMQAKFDSVCSESGRKIKRGESILYWPSGRKGYLIGYAPKAEQDFRDFEASAFDECVYHNESY